MEDVPKKGKIELKEIATKSLEFALKKATAPMQIVDLIIPSLKLFEIKLNSNIEKTREAYSSEIGRINESLEKAKMVFRGAMLIAVLLSLLSVIAFVVSISQFNQRIGVGSFYATSDFGVTAIGLLAGVSLVWIFSVLFAKSKSVALHYISNLQSEFELMEIEELEYEMRAEKLFMVNQKELKRYYDINISQLKYVFPLGIILTIIGSTAIILSLFLLDENVIALSIGSACGIMIDFVGAVYIKLYAGTIETSAKFHEKLVNTNSMYFSNVLLAKVKDNDKRNDAFVEIAKIVAANKS